MKSLRSRFDGSSLTASRPRRVRKFRSGRFAGGIVPEPGRRVVDHVLPRDGCSTLLPDRLKRQRRPAERLRPRVAEHLLGEPQQPPRSASARRHRPFRGYCEKSMANAHASARMALCCQPLYNFRPKCRRPPIQNCPGNCNDRIYEPYAGSRRRGQVARECTCSSQSPPRRLRGRRSRAERRGTRWVAHVRRRRRRPHRR
jgi:hypothetical protein